VKPGEDGVLDGDERTAVVVGAGAVGLFLQFLLQGAAGSSLLAKRASWERFQTSPLRITGALEATQYVRCHTWESLPRLDPLATVFIATRPKEVAGVLQALRLKLGKHATVVLCQDGIGVFTAANEILPKTRLVRLACWSLVERWELDHLHVTVLDRLELAGDPGDRPLLEHWRKVLSRPGVQTTVAFEPIVLEWKTALRGIASEALCALAHARNGALLDTPELESIASDLLNETAEIAALEGVHLTARDRAAAFQALDGSRAAAPAACADLRAGRHPELELFNGAVIRAARKHGRRALLNEAVLNLLEYLEKTGHFRGQPGARLAPPSPEVRET
jgi:2-dehydropantoate 2-reductase